MIRSSPALLAFVLGCASNPPAPPPPAAPAAAEPARPTESRRPAVESPAAGPPIDARPTELSAEQKTRAAARAPLVTALLDAFTSDSPTFSRDGTKVLFHSDRAGSPQLYLGEVAKPGEPPIAIAHGPERADFAEFTRDGRSILFLRDQGADENFRIYKVGLDGKDETNLTPGPSLHRDPFFEARHRPGIIVYTQHDPKSPKSELVVQPLTGTPQVVYTDPAPASSTETTPDGRRALLLRWNSSSDLVLLEVDLGTGKPRRLFPSEGTKVTINDARYSADGKRIFVSADDGAEGQYLYALDAGTGGIEAQYKQDDPASAFVSSIQVSPRGDRLAISVNAGNHTEIRILDARTLALRTKVKTPLGWIETTRYSDDGARFGLTVSTPAAPADLFSVDARAETVTPLRKDLRAGLEAMPSLTTRIDSVKAFDGLTIPVNTYLPPAAGKKLPVIVSFHGGPSWSYQVRWSVSSRFFTQLGYAYLEPNVRGSTGFGRSYEMADDREKRADWLKDLETVNAWVRTQPWADPQRIVIVGGSYGGYTVLMALTRQPTLWRTGVDLFGVADLFTFLKSTDQAIRAGFVQEFGDLDQDKELLERFSPMRDVNRIVAPLFVYAGANDPRVPRSESDLIVRALRTRNVPVEYMVAENEGHSLDRRENRIEYFTRVARFLEEQLR
jgi:dipeptidyl aminopeptidase/acylaminoacyl peptidase